MFGQPVDSGSDSAMMDILARDYYNMAFNLPQSSVYNVSRKKFFPLFKLWRPLECIAAYPFWTSHQVLHTMNGIPVASLNPWVVTFESRLPRSLLMERHWLNKWARNRLLSKKCLAIVAMSQWAVSVFEDRNRNWSGLEQARQKLIVLPPSIAKRALNPKRLLKGETLKLVFVGNDFARKGGIVCLRLAKLAKQEGLPVEIHICSGMSYGPGIHTDYPDKQQYATDLEALSLDNVTFHGKCSKSQVAEIMDKCHITMLPTLHDTFGYSIIEGYAAGLPSITTNVCAQPEINVKGCGKMLQLPTGKMNTWLCVEPPEPSSEKYWSSLDTAYRSLAEQAFKAVTAFYADREQIEAMSKAALAHVEATYNPKRNATKLAQIYDQAAKKIRVHRR